jgi:hypothetical protein
MKTLVAISADYDGIGPLFEASVLIAPVMDI